MTDAAEVSKALTLDLLARTYDRARVECAFWAECDVPAVRSVADLRRLPVLERDTVKERLPDLCARSRVPDSFTATSGTTTGQPLFIPRSADEGRALRDYRLRTGSATEAAPEHQGLVLRLLPGGRLFRGDVGSSSELIGVFLANSAMDNGWDNWDYLIAQLFGSFPRGGTFARITAVHATPSFGLLLLTRYMERRGIDPAETSVRHLIATGSGTPSATRAWLERTWNAKFITTYSCAELNGWAEECRLKPFRYHFNHTIFPEVVHPATGRQVDRGEEGRVLLTGIHPFQSTCMLLRYAVGDWARWMGYERCECGVTTPTIEFLGRDRRVVRHRVGAEGPELALASVPTLEALARFDFIPDVPRPQFRYAGSGDGRRLTLHVECFHLRDPGWERRAAGELREAVLREEPRIAEAAARHGLEFDVRLHRRGELTTDLGVR